MCASTGSSGALPPAIDHPDESAHEGPRRGPRSEATRRAAVRIKRGRRFQSRSATPRHGCPMGTRREGLAEHRQRLQNRSAASARPARSMPGKNASSGTWLRAEQVQADAGGSWARTPGQRQRRDGERGVRQGQALGVTREIQEVAQVERRLDARKRGHRDLEQPAPVRKAPPVGRRSVATRRDSVPNSALRSSTCDALRRAVLK